MTNAIAELLASIVSQNIFPQQFGFIKERNISDCIITATEYVNLLDKKSFGSNMALKIDI